LSEPLASSEKEGFFGNDKTGDYRTDSFLRPLQNVPFCPISVSGSDINPRNTQCIPAIKIFAFLDLEQK